MNIANSFLTATQKALQAWTAFLPQLNEYQKRTQFTDFTSLSFPGLTPEAVTALLTEMVEGIEEFLPLLEQDPWFGGMVQEVVSDDKFGQFTSALALDETNQYGQFKAAIPKLKEIRAIIIRNGYGWTLSPKIKSNSSEGRNGSRNPYEGPESRIGEDFYYDYRPDRRYTQHLQYADSAAAPTRRYRKGHWRGGRNCDAASSVGSSDEIRNRNDRIGYKANGAANACSYEGHPA